MNEELTRRVNVIKFTSVSMKELKDMVGVGAYLHSFCEFTRENSLLFCTGQRRNGGNIRTRPVVAL